MSADQAVTTVPGEPPHPPASRRRRRRWSIWGGAAVAVGLVAGLTVAQLLPDDASVPSGVPGSWDQAFSDDFDGHSLDTGKWVASRAVDGGGQAPFNPDEEEAWFDEGNVTVSDGDLVLTVREDAKTVNGTEYPLSSGVVESRSGLRLRPGTFVAARIDIPECDGCWPAFWGTPTETWPPEVDILEYFDSGTDEQPSFNYIKPSQTQTGPTPYGEDGTDYRDGFHVYGLLWTGSTVVPYLDGKLYRDLAADDMTADQELALVLNLSVASGGRPDPGSQMKVDWVRMWTQS